MVIKFLSNFLVLKSFLIYRVFGGHLDTAALTGSKFEDFGVSVAAREAICGCYYRLLDWVPTRMASHALRLITAPQSRERLSIRPIFAPKKLRTRLRLRVAGRRAHQAGRNAEATAAGKINVIGSPLLVRVPVAVSVSAVIRGLSHRRRTGTV